MNLLEKLGGLIRASFENPSQPLVPYGGLLDGAARSDAGVSVNVDQAMRISTVLACIKVITEDLSSLPMAIFERMPDGTMREAVEHRLYPVLRYEPNPSMTSSTFRSALLANALTHGNAFSLITRDKAARAVSFSILSSAKTAAVMVNGKLGFATTQTATGAPAHIDAENVLHVVGTSIDGIVGMSPIQCKNTFGLAYAAEKYGAQFFANGARATGVLSHPGVLDEDAYNRLKTSVQSWATGENALRPVILEEGLTWNQISVTPNEAQFLDTRKFQRSEIAALFRVPLHLLQDLERSTNNNIEHQSLDYVRFCLKPWAVRIEQELKRKVLTGNFEAEHDFNDILRGDFASQTAGFTSLRNAGVSSVDDIRKALRQNPIGTAAGGDVRLVPVNMQPLVSYVDWKPAPTPAPMEKP